MFIFDVYIWFFFFFLLCVLHGFFFKLTLYKFDTEGVSPLIASRVSLKKLKMKLLFDFLKRK